MMFRLCLGSSFHIQGNKRHFKLLTYNLLKTKTSFRQFLRVDSKKFVSASSCLRPFLLSYNLNFVFISRYLSSTTITASSNSNVYKCNSYNNNSHNSNSDHNRKNVLKKQGLIKKVLSEKQEDLRKTEERLKIKGKVLLNDFKEKKTQMKAKVGELIEKENIWTVPNFLCVFRISLSPWLGYLILDQNFDMALLVLAAAAISDLLDGWVARNFKNQSSKLGSFLDPVADKILVATMFLTLTYVDIMPLYLTCLIIIRDFTLVCAGFYIRYKSLPSPRTFTKYFDLTLATAQLAPTLISKINTTIQLITVGTSLAAPIFNFTDHIALQSLWCLTATTTVASAVSYMYARNTYRLLNVKNSKK